VKACWDSYTSGMEHSPTNATGTGWERTPCHAELPQTPESPLVIPDPEAESVELNGPLASLGRSPLHRHLI